jgi:hypothetical protein
MRRYTPLIFAPWLVSFLLNIWLLPCLDHSGNLNERVYHYNHIYQYITTFVHSTSPSSSSLTVNHHHHPQHITITFIAHSKSPPSLTFLPLKLLEQLTQQLWFIIGRLNRANKNFSATNIVICLP